MRAFFKTDPFFWKRATLKCKPPRAKHAILKSPFSFDTFAVFFVDRRRQILL
jgi:hypothetical protein